jgi:NO-binding membrane sensor protein with MHYT domain
MHFVGMLAARVPFPVDYLVLPTLLSFLICVIVVGAAVFAASAGLRTPTRLTLSACLIGAGIFTMHYIGMMALHASAHMQHAPVFVAASMAVAIGASGLALYLATERRHPPLYLSAIAFGLAVSGMHYTAMSGLTVFPHATPMLSAPALSADLLAIVVAVVAFCVSGVFLLILVPDRGRTQGEPAPSPIAAPPIASADVEIGRASYGPLGGAGAPPRRFARHLPVEREGATHYVAVESVVAVHANAHYTTIFDGTAKLFCPLPISDVESRLDSSRFVRVHRSHIVNIERVVRVKRAGDSGMVELAAADHYAVPVSRSRVGWLKSRIGTKPGEPATQSL